MKIRVYIYNGTTGKKFDETSDAQKVIGLVEAFGKFAEDAKDLHGFIMVEIVGRKLYNTAQYTEHFDGTTVRRACENVCNVISVLQ